jgi:DNA-binding MarR family transcriptional regulator
MSSRRRRPAARALAAAAPAAEGLAQLDRLVHEPARLAILAVLAVVDEADFVFVQGQTGLTSGNLATHLARLEEAGYVLSRKTFEDRKPCTLLALTPAGGAALDNWRRSVCRLLDLLP